MSKDDKKQKPGKPEEKPPKKGPPEKSGEQIIYASADLPLLLQEDGDIFSSSGAHVARLHKNVAYDPSGRYVGSLVDNGLVFQDADSLTFGPLFVPEPHTGFADLGNVPHRTLEREMSVGEGPLLIQENGDVFSGAGTHVAHLYKTLAYDPSGNYFGTLVDNRLVFQDDDSLTFGPLFVPETHPGFPDLGNIAHRTLDRGVPVNA
jgi:hypothetical protein